MSYFEDKVVIVTGGSEGIGKALVEALLQQGAKVATCSRNYDKLYNLQTQCAGKPLFIKAADVSKEAECKVFIEETIKIFGRIHILINNAGISMRALFAETDMETLHRLMDVNFWGAVYCTQHALPFITKERGDIVGVSSIAGFRGLPGRSGYSASKFALNGWLEALRTELYVTGVNVMWVCPGYTASNIRKTALNKNAEPQGESPLDEDKLMSSEECARHILKAIERRKRTLVLTVTGKETVLINKFLPSLADKLVYKFFFKNGVLSK
ncbi:MAG: SDR family oxidoreductase [Bacteroidota bacterium]|nr:SDR family oxidoreductase [Bacteroidota bacterium]